MNKTMSFLQVIYTKVTQNLTRLFSIDFQDHVHRQTYANDHLCRLPKWLSAVLSILVDLQVLSWR